MTTTAPATLANALAEALRSPEADDVDTCEEVGEVLAAALTAPGGWLDSLLAPIGKLADEWEQDEGRTWIASLGTELRDALAAARPAERERGGA